MLWQSFLPPDFLEEVEGMVETLKDNFVQLCWEPCRATLVETPKMQAYQSGPLSRGLCRDIKKSFKNFVSAVLQSLKSQSDILIPDPSLREDIRDRILNFMCPAYVSFFEK